MTSWVPVIVCPGWIEVPESWGHHIEQLVARGRKVIAFDAPHGLPLPVKSTWRGHKIELQKMETLVAVMNELGIKRADLIGRSEGAIWALLTAYYYPKMVRNVVLQNPAGLVGWSFQPFIWRWLRDVKQGFFNDEGDPPPFAPVSGGTVMARSWTRTAREVWAIMWSDMRRTLREVKKDSHKIAIVTTYQDRLFPVELLRSAREIVDMFVILHGSHTSFFSRPREFTDAIAFALVDLEELLRQEANMK
ncbi:MAG TPA: alpha/beta hydrolase [Candidatus Paceibacterota bacterium]|nr:alpha/beta hydrolase [Candidatus Paceibacterota bacterium]